MAMGNSVFRIECFRSWNFRRLRWEWRWRAVRSRNGKIMATGGEGYVRRVDIVEALDTLALHFESAVILFPEDEFGR